MTWTFDPVAGPFSFTEGPVWDGGGVVFSDIPASRILRYDIETGETAVHHEETGHANGLTMGPDGLLYACGQRFGRVVRYEADGSRTVVADTFEGDSLNSPNDLTFDSDGGLWFTDPRYEQGPVEQQPLELDHRSVYRVDPDDPSTLTRVTHDTTNPNGLAFSPDGRTLYVAQTDYELGKPSELRAYPVSDGGLGEYEVLHDFGDAAGVDGMCLTEDGVIVAAAGSSHGGPGPSLYVFAPDGDVLERHPFPDRLPTNCAFGGDDRSTLYMTAGSGCLYRIETDLVGLPVPP